MMFEFAELFVGEFLGKLLYFGFVYFDVFGLGDDKGRSLSDKLALVVSFVRHTD